MLVVIESFEVGSSAIIFSFILSRGNFSPLVLSQC